MERGIAILDGALAIGRQAEPLAPEIARTRMEAVKSDAAGVSPVSKGMLFGKVKAWFTTEKVLEPAD
jgi:hypothetical protein